MGRNRRIRRGAVFGASVLGLAALALGTAIPAGATAGTPANSTIVGSGGNTPYYALNALATLFNESEGCNQLEPTGVGGVTQEQNFSCPAPNGTTLPAGNPPYGYGSPSVGSSYSENPFNDVVEVEPWISSSTGITQLENQGTHNTSGTTTAPLNFASSARGPNTGANGKYDDQGLNFVAYGADAVDYVVFKTAGGSPTPGAHLASLTQSQIQAIWTGADKCWSDLGVKNTATFTGADDLIDPYSVFTSSAVTSTWDNFLYPDNSETYVQAQTNWPPSTLPTCKDGHQAIYNGPTFSNYATSHTIAQNEVNDIENNGDQANAIVFMSYGRWQEQKSKLGSITKLGSIGKPAVTPSETTILNGTYPVPQDLYTVYSNGSNTNIPVATSGTLNFASELGFLCKVDTSNGTPSGTPIDDPLTGVSYRTEIDKAIKSEGFFPLDGLNAGVPFDEYGPGAVTNPASSIAGFTSSAYYQYDTPYLDPSTNVPEGYCNVTTSDGNTGHS